ncbi:hypothetical protein F5B20DRAFT_406131 [Whalleya microplaca]|nr:hypothetical protein F5B20DRAFT_406131 [Whalleya microplaca]
MLFRNVSPFAIMVLAGQTIAEPVRQPYKLDDLKLAKMSVRQIFGLDRRSDDGYAPEQQFCGSGNTCAEACGKGFEQCSSNDGVVHCYDTGAKQTCCPGKTGDSCDEGYFCSSDDKGATWCCPDSMSLKECAAAYNLPGSLVSETAPGPTSTSTSNAKPTSATTTSLRADAQSTTTNAAPAATSSAERSSETAGTSSTDSSATATSSFVTVSGGSNHGPIGGLVLLAVVACAALFLNLHSR